MKRQLTDLAQAAWTTRYRLLVRALGSKDADASPAALSLGDLGSQVHRLLDPGDRSHVWLALAVMTGRLPDESLLESVAMASEFDSGEALRGAIVAAADRPGLRREVTLAGPGDVLLDVTTTLLVPYMTGIQRVVRETVARWLAEHSHARPVAWTSDDSALRDLTPQEQEQLAARTGGHREPGGEPWATVVVPWRCTVVVPEVTTSTARAAGHASFRSALRVPDVRHRVRRRCPDVGGDP